MSLVYLERLLPMNDELQDLEYDPKLDDNHVHTDKDVYEGTEK